MKYLFCLVSTLFIVNYSVAQTDANGNPVFNSISTGEVKLNGYAVSCNYYTLKNNIENKGSSVYVSDDPTLNEIEFAALNLPSDYFIITRGQSILNMIVMNYRPTRQYFVIDPGTGKQQLFPCTIAGDITEHRAAEIIEQKYDPKARIKNGVLYFNGKQFNISTTRDILKHLEDLINTQHLAEGTASDITLLSKEDIHKYVLRESKEGGKLDFFTEIKGHEYDGILIKKGVFSTKLGVALYKWGRANFEVGVNTVEDAIALYAEWQGRPANQREKDYIKLGFEKGLEK